MSVSCLAWQSDKEKCFQAILSGSWFFSVNFESLVPGVLSFFFRPVIFTDGAINSFGVFSHSKGFRGSIAGPDSRTGSLGQIRLGFHQGCTKVVPKVVPRFHAAFNGA